MDKNSIIGFVLIATVLIGFSIYSQPSEQEQRAAFVKDSTEQANRAKAEKAVKAAEYKQRQALKQKVAEDTTALFHKALVGKAKNVVLSNNKVALTLSTKGATVVKAYLKNQKGSKQFVGHNMADRSGKHDDENGVTLLRVSVSRSTTRLWLRS